MILDKLLEKKDLIHYINFRIYKLTHDIDIKKYPPKEREYQRQRLAGRCRELKKLKEVIHRNDLKSASKRMYHDIEEMSYEEQRTGGGAR